MSTYVGRSHTVLMMAAAMAGLGSWPLVARTEDCRTLRNAGKPGRLRAAPRFSSNKPHQGKREIARRRVQMLRIELDKCCKEGLKMSRNDQVDLGYVDAADDLLRQIKALMPFAYGRKNCQLSQSAAEVAGHHHLSARRWRCGMSITTTEYCMQKQHFVPAEKMTRYWTGKVWRRMCDDCKAEANERKKNEKKGGK
ncbi:MAG TPA: hypothetical protein VK149_12215 [Sideroxyarcus sp.]|nr:hypothetical protein [Sideroxyarcus sp.]